MPTKSEPDAFRKPNPVSERVNRLHAATFLTILFLSTLGVLLMADHAPLGFVAVLGALVVAGVSGVLK